MTTKKSEAVEEKSELEVLAPVEVTDRVELSDGTELLLNRMKTREVLKLLRIFTHGAGQLLGNINWGSDEFGDQLIAVLLIAVPDAEDETIEFIRAMVEPFGIDHSRKLTKAAKEANDALYSDLYDLLDNPELDDLLEILTAIIRNEAPELQSLGKKLRSLIETVSPS